MWWINTREKETIWTCPVRSGSNINVKCSASVTECNGVFTRGKLPHTHVAALHGSKTTVPGVTVTDHSQKGEMCTGDVPALNVDNTESRGITSGVRKKDGNGCTEDVTKEGNKENTHVASTCTVTNTEDRGVLAVKKVLNELSGEEVIELELDCEQGVVQLQEETVVVGETNKSIELIDEIPIELSLVEGEHAEAGSMEVAEERVEAVEEAFTKQHCPTNISTAGAMLPDHNYV